MIWLLLALLALVAGLWPFGPYQFSLMLYARLRGAEPAPAASEPPLEPETFAICLCAYNERTVIRDKVMDLLRLREAAGGDLEILVYVDAADDGTADVLEAFKDRIRLFVSPERRGKTYGMNLLVRETDAAVVMFTDANVRIDPDAVAVLRRYFADPAIGCVCSTLAYVDTEGSATASVGGAYWRFNEWSKRLETRTGSVIGADGSLFAIRRRLHEPVPKGLFDDIYVSLGVLLQGYRVVSAPELKAYETHTSEALDEFRRKIRIACECLHVHFTLWPRLRRLDAWNLYKYLTHRLARWLSGYFFLAAAVFGVLALQAAVGPGLALLVALIGGLAAWAAWALRLPPAVKLWNVVLAFAGNTIGVWRALRGKRSVTWEVPASSRRVGGEAAG